MSTTFDIIVIGTGSMGAAACYQAAKRGLRVLGLDQFDPPHDQGSHSGQTRIIRQAYFEHPDYVPLLQKAYTNWEELEAEAGKTLIHKTGLLYAGEKTGELIAGVEASAKEHQLAIEELGASAKKERFGAMYFPEQLTALFEENAGYLNAGETIHTVLDLAKKHGAQIRTNQKVISWELRNEHVVVFTANESFHAKKIIVTGGAYGKHLLPRLRGALQVTRQHIFWFDPKQAELFKAPNFSCWNIADPDYPGLFYGFPYIEENDAPGNFGFKIAYHLPGEIVHPESTHSDVVKEPKPEEVDLLRSILSKYFPAALGPLLRHKTCYYSYSPDEHFIIDALPNTEGRVIFGAGFSGHGFKFSSVVGECLVDLATEGKSNMNLDLFNVERLRKNQ